MSTHEATGSVPGLPKFIYGTAWKEDETKRLTGLAMEAGFRAVDTANQRRHYFEQGVGTALAAAISEGLVTREDLFVQTKFTDRGGQDHRFPYDPAADAGTQVLQSFDSSLDHLQLGFVDSYVLHGPSQRHGLGSRDLEIWQAMEALHAGGKVRFIGISNVAIDQLDELLARCTVRPAFVQNRCYAATGWDREIRVFCRQNGIVYQGFSLLTANVNELGSPAFRQLVSRVGKTPAQVVFRFAIQVGMIPITGTTDPLHMREDLGALDFSLSDEDMAFMEGIGNAW
ncbi:MAG: aldo/keto reductase [Acidobacteriota bacterium]